MWIVAIAWMYVALMMSMAEATSPQGTAIGAIITFVFYGLAPVALVMYVLRTPGRRRALQQRQADEHARHMALVATENAGSASPMGQVGEASGDTSALAGSPDEASQNADGGGLSSRDAVAPERKEP